MGFSKCGNIARKLQKFNLLRIQISFTTFLGMLSSVLFSKTLNTASSGALMKPYWPIYTTFKQMVYNYHAIALGYTNFCNVS
ncbi:hypothetical protein CW304_02655 [Bacillus sp. UFRGS-B20]|nr:hypothetical protein CW304_02655 [Bacillus sp. UFRGS-B20]